MIADMPRRGQVAILVLVFLIVLLTGATLFLFITQSGVVEGTIADARFVQSASFREAEIRFYLGSAAEPAFIRAYQEIAAEQGQFVLASFDDRALEARLEEKAMTFFADERTSFVPSDISLHGVNLTDSQVTFYFNEFPILVDLFDAQQQLLSKVIYRPSLVVSRDLDRLGLYSFSTLKQVADVCSHENTLASLKTCFETKLPAFTIRVEELGQGKQRVVFFTSKRAFLIRGLWKTVDLSIHL